MSKYIILIISILMITGCGSGGSTNVEAPEIDIQPDTVAVVDTDSDGVADDSDNCPDIANPDQENADSGSAGDACDLSVTLQQVPANKLAQIPDFSSQPVSQQAGLNITNDTVQPEATDNGSGLFRGRCIFSADNYDDPIKKFSKENLNHHHMYFGNDLVDAFSTNDVSVTSSQNIRLNGSSEEVCVGGSANRSAYWMPVLYDAGEDGISGNDDDQPRAPFIANLYYKVEDGVDPTTVQLPPADLQIIAGDPTRIAHGDYVPLRWSCNAAVDGYVNTSDIPVCDGTAGTGSNGEELSLFMVFPRCWDGVNLTDVDDDNDPFNDDSDEPNNSHSHMAYPITNPNGPQMNNGFSYSKACPSSHPTPVLTPQLVPRWDTNLFAGKSSAGAYLSSDLDMTGDIKCEGGNGCSTHADWMNGWDMDVMQHWLTHCIHGLKNCGTGTVIENNAITTTGNQMGGPTPKILDSTNVPFLASGQDRAFTNNKPMNPNPPDGAYDVTPTIEGGTPPYSLSYSVTSTCDGLNGVNLPYSFNTTQVTSAIDSWALKNSNTSGDMIFDWFELAVSGDQNIETINGPLPCALQNYSVTVTDDNDLTSTSSCVDCL